MKSLKPLLIPSLLTFVGLSITFMLSSFLLGQKAPTILILIVWFVLPYLALIIANRFNHLTIENRFKKVKTLASALIGMILSFALILFLTYKHLDTDFGVLFKITFLVNLVMIPLYWYMRNNVAEAPKLKL